MAAADVPPDVPAARTEGRGCGLGCLVVALLWSGLFGGGMLGVMVAWIVGQATRCPAPADLPACNMWPYLVIGAGVGTVLLPGIVVWRLWRRAPVENSERS